MINKAIKILITSVVISVLTGCSIFGIIGSGNRVEEERIVDSFTSINLSCVADIVITQGSEQSVVISVDDNLISYVKTSVRNGNLSISTTETINSNIGAKVYVTVTEFKGFTMDVS